MGRLTECPNISQRGLLPHPDDYPEQEPVPERVQPADGQIGLQGQTNHQLQRVLRLLPRGAGAKRLPSLDGSRPADVAGQSHDVVITSPRPTERKSSTKVRKAPVTSLVTPSYAS